MTEGDGDLRVLLVMDAVLSVAFSALAVWGLALVGVLTFSWETVAFAAIGLFALTYLVVLR